MPLAAYRVHSVRGPWAPTEPTRSAPRHLPHTLTPQANRHGGLVACFARDSSGWGICHPLACDTAVSSTWTASDPPMKWSILPWEVSETFEPTVVFPKKAVGEDGLGNTYRQFPDGLLPLVDGQDLQRNREDQD